MPRRATERAHIALNPIRENKQVPASPIIIASGAIFIC